MDYIDNDRPQPNFLVHFESRSKRGPISEWFVLSAFGSMSRNFLYKRQHFIELELSPTLFNVQSTPILIKVVSLNSKVIKVVSDYQ
jgi:hypothetical protein